MITTRADSDCAASLDTGDLEVLILNALAENYASEPVEHENEAKSNVIVDGLPQALASEDGDVEAWVSQEPRV